MEKKNGWSTVTPVVASYIMMHMGCYNGPALKTSQIAWEVIAAHINCIFKKFIKSIKIRSKYFIIQQGHANQNHKENAISQPLGWL